jgi:hypothetical protein
MMGSFALKASMAGIISLGNVQRLDNLRSLNKRVKDENR